MRIAIVGAGVAGSYLYRLLRDTSHVVDLFDKRVTTRCGIRPCAWGTSRGFDDLVASAGLEPRDYILVQSDHVIIDDVRIRGDLKTFDKRRLIRDLRGDAMVIHTEPDATRYDRIIDCTGVSRAILPPIEDDIIFPCVQYRIRSDTPLANRIVLTSVGYAWSFPLSQNEYHVGCGSLVMDPREVLVSTGWLSRKPSRKDVVCACRSSVRLTSPHYSLPFVLSHGGTEIWGAGEAIGCVAPLAGDGVVPGMSSVQLLLESWDNPVRYRKAVLREFRWMKEERTVIDKLRYHAPLRLKDAWVLKKNARRMAMEVGVKEATKLMRNLRQRLSSHKEPSLADLS